MSSLIIGRNPVIEALKADREIEKLTVGIGTEGSIKKILAMAADKKIPIHYAEKAALDRIAEGGVHQGVVAQVSDFAYCEIADILALAQKRGEPPLLVLLDNLEDPHNFGAIIRTAETVGCHGIVIPKRRAVGITEVVSKASAGAVEHMLCAKVSNMVMAIEQLKEAGLWIAACEAGGPSYYKSDLKGPLALVIGSEGSGIGRLVKEHCDFMVSIPMKGKITSLNASNAAAVLLHEIARQRQIAYSGQ